MRASNQSRTILSLMLMASASAQSPPIETVLGQIQGKVEVFENRLPDFVCREVITSHTESDAGGIAGKQTVVESVFTGRQKHASFGGISFAEERKIEKIDGVAAASNEMPKGMFRVGGGYSSVLAHVFDRKGQESYSFNWGNSENNPERSVEIEFATRKDNKRVKVKGSDGMHTLNGTGMAWFDASTYEVKRLEEQILPPDGNPENALTITVDYEPVVIGDVTFHLPRRVTAIAHRTIQGHAQRGVYEAEYTEYRKYGSSSAITFDQRH